MKTKHATKNLQEAINVFLRELPDPKGSDVSTVTDQFTIAGQEVVLTAQKAKGSTGFRWLIDYPN